MRLSSAGVMLSLQCGGVHFMSAGVPFARTVFGQKAGRGGETDGEEGEMVAEAGNQVFRVPAHFSISWTPDVSRMGLLNSSACFQALLESRNKLRITAFQYFLKC
ncbi:hypothetical protein ILYODFUR_024521 [Ilyodon furcidens]|uniref:Uncharacterized protein n=1 Tax=Ilyodon furcidens TaxID=33524 RepID=A0ABV0TQG9_9TELE